MTRYREYKGGYRPKVYRMSEPLRWLITGEILFNGINVNNPLLPAKLRIVYSFNAKTPARERLYRYIHLHLPDWNDAVPYYPDDMLDLSIPQVPGIDGRYRMVKGRRYNNGTLALHLEGCFNGYIHSENKARRLTQ